MTMLREGPRLDRPIYRGRHEPSPSQRAAIEAAPQPLLVLAGPGAGKTYCLIERIRHLIDGLGVEPERICAFTFTNKAAGEIASRLHELGPAAERVKRGTVHAFCAELLREFGEAVDLAPGFGIADEEYQRSVLRRLRVPAKLHGAVLGAFARYRFRGEPLGDRFEQYYHDYRRFTAERNVADFDSLVVEAARLLNDPPIAAELRSRWDVLLVDEFQDLTPVQYSLIRELGREHRHVFAVGDDQQSIYSWAGADPKVFLEFANDFGISPDLLHRLQENRRCPRQVVTFALELIAINESLFDGPSPPLPERESPFPVSALSFADQDAEHAWIMDDLERDHAEHGLDWGEVALLYRTHEIGNALETCFLERAIPCRLAQGRALSEDRVVAYVLAALRVIAHPRDEIHREGFYQAVLPKPLIDYARARAEAYGHTVVQQLERMARRLPAEHGDRKKIWRGYYALRNLSALARNHDTLSRLVEEILSERVGTYRTVLEDRHDELTDPASHEEAVSLSERLEEALAAEWPIWIPRLGGMEIGLEGMLREMGFRDVRLGGSAAEGAEQITERCAPTLGLALGVFKAAQLIRTREFSSTFRDFVAVDLETTDNDVSRAEIVEIAAVRVRAGQIVDEYRSLVRPRVPITAGALATHGISEQEVADAPYFEAAWPAFRDFCGGDVLVAHNGYQFDFPILRRMATELAGGADFSTYDTLPLARALHSTSAKLVDLARLYGIPTGQSHRALDDTRALAMLFPALSETRTEYARKTALANLLDHLAVALVLSEPRSLSPEAARFLEFARTYALGRYSDCLEFYRVRRETAGDPTVPTVEELIERLGGEQLMRRLRAEKTAAERYPAAMARLRRLLDCSADGPLSAQIRAFLERAVLSKCDGVEPAERRVNLLTLHSTKGLEFSRVYIVGAEDGQLPGISPNGEPPRRELEEARRLLYVGMTRAKDRLVMTRAASRGGKPTGGHRFLDEMGLTPRAMPG